MPDLNAAVGLEQLRKSDQFLARRTEIAMRYLEAFAVLDFLETPPAAPGHSWHLFPVFLVLDRLAISRDEFLFALAESNIGSSVHYKPLHLMSYYAGKYGLSPSDFPRSLNRYRRVLSLPIYPAMSDEDVERVIDGVTSVGKTHYRANG
jgi:dTDP-4-amino-4,6-dideoxygalactose transaminase